MKNFELFELYDVTDEFHDLLIGSYRDFKDVKSAAAEYYKNHPDCVLQAYRVTKTEWRITQSYSSEQCRTV